MNELDLPNDELSAFWHQITLEERREREEQGEREQHMLESDPAYNAWLDEYDQQTRGDEPMVDATKYTQSDSEWLKASEVKGKALKVVISETGVTEMPSFRNPDQTEEKLYLKFEGKEKGMILNVVNAQVLIDAYGADTDGWVGKEIGISTKPIKVQGEMRDTFQVDLMDKEFDDSIPFSWVLVPGGTVLLSLAHGVQSLPIV